MGSYLPIPKARTQYHGLVSNWYPPCHTEKRTHLGKFTPRSLALLDSPKQVAYDRCGTGNKNTPLYSYRLKLTAATSHAITRIEGCDQSLSDNTEAAGKNRSWRSNLRTSYLASVKLRSSRRRARCAGRQKRLSKQETSTCCKRISSSVLA